MKKHFTTTEKSNGELAVRDLSEKARKFYSGADVGVFEYEDSDIYFKLEEEAEANGIEFDDYAARKASTRYAIAWYGDAPELGYTLKQVEEIFEELADEEE